MRATGRLRGGSKVVLEVLDISLAGCMIDSPAWSPKIGDSLLVKFDGLEAMPGEVVWVDQRNAGIVFEQLLHEAVFQRLDRSMPHAGSC